MNKTIISWTHYVYVTITASVLAYVTVMDSSSSSEEDSAINMLPTIDTIYNSQSPDIDETVEPEIVEAEIVEPETVEPEIVEAELVNEEPIKNDAEPKQQSQSGSSGGKLKKNKTKTNNKNKKANKTRGRK